MAVIETEIWSGPLIANSLNYSAFFSEADYLYMEPSHGEDWSVSGNFIEIDCVLLVTISPGIKRQLPIASGDISTRELIFIPREIADSGLLMELVLQVSFSVEVVVFSCVVESMVAVNG